VEKFMADEKEPPKQPSYKTEGKSTRQLLEERKLRLKYEEEKATGAPVPDTFEEWHRLG
jgi:hypothetical protein